MSKRLEILKNSLANKEQELNRKFDVHFATVKQANGQPLNDKSNGRATLNKWERQSDSIRSTKESIEKTKRAIEWEEATINGVNRTNETIPKEILSLVESGELVQWRKHPHTFFVPGVDKARIVWDANGMYVGHKYSSQITDQEQRAKFFRVFNPIGLALNSKCHV